MTISDLHNKLKEIGINEDQYFLHGLFGSKDDNEKISLSIKKGKYELEFETYYKERGEKHSIRTFTTENEACKFSRGVQSQAISCSEQYPSTL